MSHYLSSVHEQRTLQVTLCHPRLRNFGERMIRCHLSKHDFSTTGASGSHLTGGVRPTTILCDNTVAGGAVLYDAAVQ
jgi:hypothetical protein